MVNMKLHINKWIFRVVSGMVAFDLSVCIFSHQYLLLVLLVVLYPIVLIELTGLHYVSKKLLIKLKKYF